MTAAGIRRSRWTRPDRRINFHDGDLEICKLLAPRAQTRYPWGYTYLPTRYFAPLLKRGASSIPNRLSALRGEDYLAVPDQGRNNCRDIIWQLGKAGAAEVRALGHKIELASHALSHELGACLVAANIELGARQHDLPIAPVTSQRLAKRPDWPLFSLGGKTIFLEFDTGTESSDVIKAKYEAYLALLHSDGAIREPLFLFITTKPQRVDTTLISTLKMAIDLRRYPYAYAEHFAFGVVAYDKYLNTIPGLTGAIISQPLRRAGRLAPFQFQHR